jgi:hypothetical protein
MSETANTRNPTRTVIKPMAPKAPAYTRKDLLHDLQEVSEKSGSEPRASGA